MIIEGIQGNDGMRIDMRTPVDRMSDRAMESFRGQYVPPERHDIVPSVVVDPCKGMYDTRASLDYGARHDLAGASTWGKESRTPAELPSPFSRGGLLPANFPLERGASFIHELTPIPEYVVEPVLPRIREPSYPIFPPEPLFHPEPTCPIFPPEPAFRLEPIRPVLDVAELPGEYVTQIGPIVQRIDTSHGDIHLNQSLFGVPRKEETRLFGGGKDPNYTDFHRRDL